MPVKNHIDTLIDSTRSNQLTVHFSDSLSDSLYYLLKKLYPEALNHLSTPWYETLLSNIGAIGIPLLVFALGHYIEKIITYNRMLDELHSYKAYSFNCVEMIYTACLSQSHFIKEYLKQFDKYELSTKLVAISNTTSSVVDRLEYSKLYSACVEHTMSKNGNAFFKRFQDQLSIASNVLQEVVPTHQYFSSKVMELERQTMEYVKQLNSMGSSYRGITTVHSFYHDVCQSVVDNNYTARHKTQTEEAEYFIQYDKLEALCEGMTVICDKHQNDSTIQIQRVQVENLCGELGNHILNVKSLFKQYKDVFVMYSERLEGVALEIKSSSEKLCNDRIIRRRAFGLIGKKLLPTVLLDFSGNIQAAE